MKRSTAIPIAIAAVLALLLLRPEKPPAGEYRVVEVADGDSFTLRKGAVSEEIRLFGIDCPERTQPFSNKARRVTRKMLGRGSIRVEEVGQDRYGRRLAWVYLDSLCLNRYLVAEGLAWHFTRYSDDPALARLERIARKAERGLWSQSDPVPPWEFRNRKKTGKGS